jgi:GAF domain-containing protein
MNSRELVSCAEVAMMTAKAHGKNQIVTFGDVDPERPDPGEAARDARSISHLKLLQSLSGKLNRLNDVKQIGEAIATELRLLIDYHNCRVVLRSGDDLIPVAFVGEYDTDGASAAEAYTAKVGQGVTGRAVETGEALLIPNALECDFAYRIPGTDELEESLAVVPLRYGSRVTGAIVISKLGRDQFDSDDIRLLEVLAGHASVALENAHLYEHQRREAEGANALLAFLANALEASADYTSAQARWITDAALVVGQELDLDREALKRLELGARILAPADRPADVGPIPLEARIVLVCHAFHAMTSGGAPGGRLPHDEALRRLGADAKFDPKVVETFVRLYDLGDVEPAG